MKGVRALPPDSICVDLRVTDSKLTHFYLKLKPLQYMNVKVHYPTRKNMQVSKNERGKALIQLS